MKQAAESNNMTGKDDTRRRRRRRRQPWAPPVRPVPRGGERGASSPPPPPPPPQQQGLVETGNNNDIKSVSVTTTTRQASSESSLPSTTTRQRGADPPQVRVTRKVQELVGWPTDTFAVDWVLSAVVSSSSSTTTTTTSTSTNNGHVIKNKHAAVHTVLVFVPGNPGLVEWYIAFFTRILVALGPGYAVRGASYAGHSIDPEQIDVENTTTATHSSISSVTNGGVTAPRLVHCDASPKTLAWTIDGQVRHKIAYWDKVVKQDFCNDNNNTRYVWVGHSIGCHLIQRMLVVRPDLCRATQGVLFLMPFIRMDAPLPQQQLLDLAAQHPKQSTWILKTAARLLTKVASSDTLREMLKSTMDRPEHRAFTAELLRRTKFPRNFLGLGLEEIRHVPQTTDVPALRYICREENVPMCVLYAGKDHWGLEFHLHDLQSLLDRRILPAERISLIHRPELKHDFITLQQQSDAVADLCIGWILALQNKSTYSAVSRSKL